MRTTFDIAIVGSGFSGSLMALIAKRLGRSVVVLERSKHPRFAIGESSTPLANLLLEQLSNRYDLPQLRDLTKWGSWQRTHPKIACGLKRGFTFYHHTLGQAFSDDQNHRNQLLVAASPHDAIADTHWYRPDFDHFLVRQAQEAGAEILDELSISNIAFSDSGAALDGVRHGASFNINAKFVIDASGLRGSLHRALDLPEKKPPHMPATQGLFAHFTNVARWDTIHFDSETLPFPADDAAVHHIFDGGWIWILRFNNGITSAGAALTDARANEIRASEGAPAWERLLKILPSVRALFAHAKPCTPFVHAPRLSFLSGQIIGPSWAMLPSAAGFIDPLLSTGFAVTLLGITRLSRILEDSNDRDELQNQLKNYASKTQSDLASVERLIGALYATMNDFELFSALTQLYFAAVSFAESALRLDRPEKAGDSFLLMDHPEFAARSIECVNMALQRPVGCERIKLLKYITEAIEPINVAGLCDATKRNWYPANAESLLQAADKLGADRADVKQMLVRCGFVNTRNGS